jgi:cellulose synthase operon protein C
VSRHPALAVAASLWLVPAWLWVAAPLLCVFPAPASAGLSESWYLARGRANVRIGNHSAAIEAFQKALEANPASREASKALASAYLANGETDRAVAQLDRYLARFDDDPDAAFEQARLLAWSRYAYRSGDAVRYLEMGLARRDDPARRRELAHLLARDRATVDEALREYDRLLAATPGDRALREERLKSLLWVPARRQEAIGELERLSDGGKDAGAERQLAILLADEPRRASEAADRMAPLLRATPEDGALRHARARALARAGRRSEARGEYDRLIGRGGGLDARLERAELLAADPATREEARAAYEVLVREAPRSRRARVGYARILGGEKETSREAISQYEVVLSQAPENAEAHRGLALAHAWNGDTDRALAHASRASGRGVTALERELRAGREPAIGAGARFVSQPGGAWRLSGGGAFASGRADPTPFTSSAVEIGFESLTGDGATAEGSVVDVRGELRPGPGRRLALEVAWAGARRDGALGGGARYHAENGGVAWELGAARRFRRDSLRAYAGEQVEGAVAGAAADNLLDASVQLPVGPALARFGVRGGAVTAASGRANAAFGASARADVAVFRSGALVVQAGVAGDAAGWSRDVAGNGADPDPLAPRYFSPPLFATVSPRLALVHDAGLGGRVVLEVGPAIQLTAGPGGRAQLGGDARLSVSRRIASRVVLGLDLRGERVASAYARVDGSAYGAVLF